MDVNRLEIPAEKAVYEAPKIILFGAGNTQGGNPDKFNEATTDGLLTTNS